MAWTHCVSDIPLKNWSCNPEINVVRVDEDVYFFGYDNASQKEDGMQVVIFHTKTHSWTIVQPSTREERRTHAGFAPKDEIIYFVAALNQRVYVCVGDRMNIKGREIHVFDTRSLRWICVDTTGDVPSGYMLAWACACENDGHVYMCADYFRGIYREGKYIWALDVRSMRWKIVANGGWINSYIPRCVVPYENRIYVLLEWLGVVFDTGNDNITYFDLASMKWERLQPLGTKPFSNQQWIPFVHRDSLYVFLNETRVDDRDIVKNFGNRKINEVVLRYSFVQNDWKEVSFKGITPPDALDLVCVVDNITVFVSREKKKVYILDFLPSLRSMCFEAVRKYQIDAAFLPKRLKRELSMYGHHST